MHKIFLGSAENDYVNSTNLNDQRPSLRQTTLINAHDNLYMGRQNC